MLVPSAKTEACLWVFVPVSLLGCLTLPFAPPPQLRRSPIKKVRKSLALDIVDEDMKLLVSPLPKAYSLVMGCRWLLSCGRSWTLCGGLQEALSSLLELGGPD